MNNLPKVLKDSLDYDLNNCDELDMDGNYINISDVLKAHYILADYFTDDSSGEILEKMLVGVQSYDLLASAVGRQCVEFSGKKKYSEKLDICSTLFYGLVKNHAFHDGNKRTALLVLLYQLQEYKYFPIKKFHEFEKLVIAVAEDKLEVSYKYIWKKFCKKDDADIKTISAILRKMVEKKNSSFHMNITTREFCNMLENVGVVWDLDKDKIKLSRDIRSRLRRKKLTYTIYFSGWTRQVDATTARNTAKALSLNEEYPSFASWANPESNIYKLVSDFEIPLRRLKDK